MTRPCRLRRAVTNRHRHAIEQASRRWRGGRRDGSARTRRKILISTQAASDGVWEFVGSDEAAALVGAQLDQGGPEACADACRALVDLAAQRWRDAEDLYRDDITCVVARLGE